MPVPDGHMWTVLSGSTYCQVTNNGACFTDGVGGHGNQENCVVRAAVTLYATASYFNTEENYDYIQIGTTRYSGASAPTNVPMAAGQTARWYADASVTFGGFIICGSLTEVVQPPSIHPPPPSPSPPPPSPGICQDAPAGETGYTIGGQTAPKTTPKSLWDVAGPQCLMNLGGLSSIV